MMETAVESIGELVRTWRRRIDRQATTLGPFVRRPCRVGRPVTQEEMSEAVGVSRQWYCMIEIGEAERVSLTLASRLAEALMLDDEDRATLFRSAVPELAEAHMDARAPDALDAVRAMQHCVNRLHNATTKNEAFGILCEVLAQFFPDALLIHSAVRDADGERWEPVATGGDSLERSFIAQTDSSWLYPQISLPGETETNDVQIHPKLDAPISCLQGRVRSRGGLIAGIAVHHVGPRTYSGPEHALMSTLTAIGSMALA